MGYLTAFGIFQHSSWITLKKLLDYKDLRNRMNHLENR